MIDPLLPPHKHGGMIEKETQPFFVPDISIYLISFLFLYINDFLIV